MVVLANASELKGSWPLKGSVEVVCDGVPVEEGEKGSVLKRSSPVPPPAPLTLEDVWDGGREVKLTTGHVNTVAEHLFTLMNVA